MWSPPPCDTDPTDIVVFADPALEACVLQGLGGNPAPTFITVATAALQVAVNCPGKGITDLGGLEAFTGLVALDLTGNAISAFGFAGVMTSLSDLKIGVNRLEQLDLSDNSALMWLDASNNQLQSVTTDADAEYEMLDLSYNQLTSFDLSDQSALQLADLSNNPGLSSVLDRFNPSLSALTSLSYLDLSGTGVTTIGSATSIAVVTPSRQNPHPPASLGSLTTLYLQCAPTFDCSSLGLDQTYSAMQSSGCLLNNNDGNWVPVAVPQCPNGQ
jgi:Leucine-rich repeat (LRR) protein